MLDCESKTLLDQRATQPEKIFFYAARTTVGLACQCGEISACHSAGNNTKNKTEDGSPSLTSAGSHIPRARKYQPKFAKCLQKLCLWQIKANIDESLQYCEIPLKVAKDRKSSAKS